MLNWRSTHSGTLRRLDAAKGFSYSPGFIAC